MTFKEIAELLLSEAEGPMLDFKRDQFPFQNASDDEKSKLLKDVLAFTNTPRRADAYIFIGVQEMGGARSTIYGIDRHIDDAALHQFVNSKTNRPVEFSYIPLEMEGKQVALIRIPMQQRPIYLLKNYGSLEKEVVYLRRGSSTDNAKLEEVALMGKHSNPDFDRSAKLSAFFALGKDAEVVEKSAVLSVIQATIPNNSEFPDYGMSVFDHGNGITSSMLSAMKNRDFYRQYAGWLQEVINYKAVRLCVKNTGNAVARDVKLVITLSDSVEDMVFCPEYSLPRKPNPNTLFTDFAYNLSNSPDVSCDKKSNQWKIVADMGKIQAGDVSISETMLCVSASKSIEVRLKTEIFTDDLDAPIKEELSLKVVILDKIYTVDDFIGHEDVDLSE